MQSIFIEKLEEFVVFYLGTVLVEFKKREEHMQHLKTVLQKVREHRLSLRLPECELGKQRVNHLGFVIEQQQVSANPKKVSAMEGWAEELLTRRSERGFLGLVGNYRRRQLLKEDPANLEKLSCASGEGIERGSHQHHQPANFRSR